MENNEELEVNPKKELVKEIATEAVKSAAIQAAAYTILIGVGLSITKIGKMKEQRKAKKEAEKTE